MSQLRSILIIALVAITSGCDDLSGFGKPDELVAFGIVRPVSCEPKGPRSYTCIMKNQSDGLRKTYMECASFDSQGRVIGTTKRVHALLDVILNPGEERVAVIYHEDGASSIVCADIKDSIPSYNEAKELAANPEAKDITTILPL